MSVDISGTDSPNRSSPLSAPSGSRGPTKDVCVSTSVGPMRSDTTDKTFEDGDPPSDSTCTKSSPEGSTPNSTAESAQKPLSLSSVTSDSLYSISFISQSSPSPSTFFSSFSSFSSSSFCLSSVFLIASLSITVHCLSVKLDSVAVEKSLFHTECISDCILSGKIEIVSCLIMDLYCSFCGIITLKSVVKASNSAMSLLDVNWVFVFFPSNSAIFFLYTDGAKGKGMKRLN